MTNGSSSVFPNSSRTTATSQVIRVTNGSSLVVRTGAILGIGPQGPIGPQGETGPQGVPGTYIWTGSAPPLAASVPPPRDQDWWINPGTSATDPNIGQISIYHAASNSWTVTNTSIRGPVGPTGPTGPLKEGTITTGPAGSNAAVQIVGVPPNQVINMTIPQGAAGNSTSGNATFDYLLLLADRPALP
jgi:hypothetical protein